MLYLLKLLGRPLYYIFVFFVIATSSLLLLIKKILFSIKIPRIRLPTFQTATLKVSYQHAVKRSNSPRKSKTPRGMFSRALVRPNQIFSVITILVISTMFYYFILRDLPSISLLSDSPPSLTTKIFDRNGVLLYQIYKDENRSLVNLSDLPPHVVKATLAAEDKNFYSHHGFDFSGILRAAYNNVSCFVFRASCFTLQGGSTITQQLIKNTLLTPERTLSRKLKELILSLLAEVTYSKNQILEMYLNQVSYGGTAYGIEQASWQFFNKSARDLTLPEGAFLAGLPIAPTTLSPFGTNPHLAKIRQQQVLENMVNLKDISEDDKVAALNTPLMFNPQKTTISAPHFVMYVKNLLVEQYGEDLISRGGLSITTSLDSATQNLLQNTISSELSSLKQLNVGNGAGLILDPQKGEILAMVGSNNFFDTTHNGQVNVTLSPRQPGSSIKPITYALAFSNGSSPANIIEDSPVCFRLPNQPDYCPQNYDKRFHGRVSLRTALASSYNIPAIKLLNSYGLDNMIALAAKLGITTWKDPSRFGLSLTLGGGEVTMLDLASVYSVFANGGLKVAPRAILSIKDSFGHSLTPTQPPPTIVLDPAVAYQINSVLSDPLARAPAFGNHSVLNVSPDVAVKTGTTNNLRDNWTIGYTPNILVATWVGNNDNSPMSQIASGITGASSIWAKVMQQLLTRYPPTPFPLPANLVKQRVSCSPIRYEYLLPGSFITPNCTAISSGTIPETKSSTSLR